MPLSTKEQSQSVPPTHAPPPPPDKKTLNKEKLENFLKRKFGKNGLEV